MEQVIKRKKIDPMLVLIYVAVGFFALFCLIPFIIVISASLSEEKLLLLEGASLLPRGFSTIAYQYVFRFSDQIIRAYGVSIFVTVVGTVLNMACMLPFAYAVAKPTFRYRRILTFYIFFTVMFNGGLVPTYMLIKKYLNMYDSIWVLIIPLLVQPGNIVLLRVFFQSFPMSLYESAKIDGASEFTQFFKIGTTYRSPTFSATHCFA